MGLTTDPIVGPGGVDRDVEDFKRLRHARDRSAGFAVGQYLQPAPMLFTRDGHNVFLGDMYRGASAFLICAGPSLASHDLTRLDQRGVLTMAVNNAATVVRPRLWCSVDDPGNFADAIWRDPGIQKFVPLAHMEKKFIVRDASGALVKSRELVGDMPAVFGYRRNESFHADQWMTEDTFNWGNHGDRADADGNKGSRSVMYVALRLLFYLGVRQVFLLGCDFRMQNGSRNYVFDQDRTPSSVRGNNQSYRAFNQRMQHLLPHFDQVGFHVYNCTPGSGLTVFPHLRYEEAVEAATAVVPKRIVTSGMYDRQARERKQKREQSQPQSQIAPPDLRPQFRDPERFARSLPGVTLVVPMESDRCAAFPEVWKTWVRYKTWMLHLPLIVLQRTPQDQALDLDNVLADHHDARILKLPSEPQWPRQQQWEFLKLKAAEAIPTPWYLMLAPDSVATETDDWISPQLFQEDGAGRRPVLIGSSWSYTKPAAAFAQLDDWADTVPELADCPRLDLPFDAASDRICHETITGWSYLARTEWTRHVVQHLAGGLPCRTHETYLHFCAARLQERMVRIPMKKHGWDHSYGREAAQVLDRCRRALSAARNSR